MKAGRLILSVLFLDACSPHIPKVNPPQRNSAENFLRRMQDLVSQSDLRDVQLVGEKLHTDLILTRMISRSEGHIKKCPRLSTFNVVKDDTRDIKTPSGSSKEIFGNKSIIIFKSYNKIDGKGLQPDFIYRISISTECYARTEGPYQVAEIHITMHNINLIHCFSGEEIKNTFQDARWSIATDGGPVGFFYARHPSRNVVNSISFQHPFEGNCVEEVDLEQTIFAPIVGYSQFRLERCIAAVERVRHRRGGECGYAVDHQMCGYYVDYLPGGNKH